ncbi:MAG: hypothetical protein AB1Z21_11040 [Synechococcaceae cyanobacterium]
MRSSFLYLALAGLLGSAALAPAAALAYPGAYRQPGFAPLPTSRYGYAPGYGPSPVDDGYWGGSPGYYGSPVAVEPVPYEAAPRRRCSPGTALAGAAVGGGLGAILARGSRNRRWALPMGAAVGGILGGVISGC